MSTTGGSSDCRRQGVLWHALLWRILVLSVEYGDWATQIEVSQWQEALGTQEMPTEQTTSINAHPPADAPETGQTESPTVFLYKYMEYEHGLSSISRNRLKISTFDTLNDPYEMLPVVANKDGAHATPLQIRQRFLLPLSTKAGFICLSAKITDPVLWAHYARRHTGMAFEFEFPANQGGITEVIYSKQRVKWQDEDIRAAHGEANDRFFCDGYEHLIKTKSDRWSYEAEYRFLVPISDQSLEDGLHFKAMPHQFFRRVILGFCCPPLETAIRCILDGAGFQKVGVVRAELSDRDFRMVIPNG